MKYVILYRSVTGNTKRLAEHIHSQLNEDCLYMGQEYDSIINEADLICIGFWTDKGHCDESTIELLKKIKNKKLFLFGTAGFGGSPEYFESIIGNVKQYVDPTCQIIGTYMCQGKMPVSVRERYQKMLDSNPYNEQFKSLLVNFDNALTHPNQDDLDALVHQIQLCL